jgi:hypothetical protein
MKKFLWSAIAIGIAVSSVLALPNKAAAAALTVDVSWPNCQAILPQNIQSGIMGVTGGLDFTPNQCVRSEAIALPNVALYMNTGWPGTDFQVQFKSSPKQCGVADNLCLAYNYGFHAAAYALAYANSQLVHSSTWWLDVETENSWTTNALQNRAALEGMVAAIQQKVLGSSVGFYSYPSQWAQIVGAWRPPFPAWVATGTLSENVARQACHAPSFTGSAVSLAQYTQGLDLDYPCS